MWWLFHTRRHSPVALRSPRGMLALFACSLPRRMVGDLTVFCGVVALTMSQAAWLILGPDMLKALDWRQVAKISLRTTIYTFLMLFVSVGFLCLWIFVSSKDVFDIMSRIGLPTFSFKLTTFEGGLLVNSKVPLLP